MSGIVRAWPSSITAAVSQAGSGGATAGISRLRLSSCVAAVRPLRPSSTSGRVSGQMSGGGGSWRPGWDGRPRRMVPAGSASAPVRSHSSLARSSRLPLPASPPTSPSFTRSTRPLIRTASPSSDPSSSRSVSSSTCAAPVSTEPAPSSGTTMSNGTARTAAAAEMSEIQKNLASKNAEYAASFPLKHLATAPAKHYAIVTCMDSRIDNFQAFGVELGDAHIIRNAGGNARDALRSLVISQHMLQTREIVLIKHTRCGMQMVDEKVAVDKILNNVRQAHGDDAVAKAVRELDHVCWGCWPDVEQAVRDDVVWLRSQTAISGAVSGWVYDVDTGSVHKVDI